MGYDPVQGFHRRIPHARKRYPAGRDVQLSLARATGSGRPPFAAYPPDGGYGVEAPFAALRGHVRRARTALDSPREAAAGAAVAMPLFGAQRADADGAVELQPVVPVVRGPEHGRPDLGLHGVLEEPGALAGGRGGARLLPGGRGAGARERPALQRTLHGGRNPDRSLGGAEKFQAAYGHARPAESVG